MLLRRLVVDTLVGKSWLDDHVKNFVLPNIPGGEIPDVNTFADPIPRPNGGWSPNAYDAGGGYLNFMRTKPEVLPAFLELWTEAKRRAAGKTIMLAGRDTWMFEVLARLEGTKTIFRPDISSATCAWIAKYDPDRESFKPCYGLDSGNVGSIPKGLGCADFGLVYQSSYDMRRQLLKHSGTGPYVEVYNVLEAMPKYWSRAVMSDRDSNPYPAMPPPSAKVIQKIGAGEEEGTYSFQIAAVGTILLANYWLKQNPNYEEVFVRRARLKASMKALGTKRNLRTSLSARRFSLRGTR